MNVKTIRLLIGIIMDGFASARAVTWSEERRSAGWVQAGFFAQLIHHPDELTFLPGKMVQGPVASAGFPWN
jgi:hypothetical protein